MIINVGKKDVFWSYVSLVVSLTSNVILLPVIVCYLTDDSLGLWYLFQSLGGITVLFDFGFNATFSRNITYCWSGAKKLKKESVETTVNGLVDYNLMKKVIVTCKRIYFIISFFAITFLLIFGTIYIMYVSRNIPGKEYLIAWIIYTIAIFLNLYYGYFSSFLRGVGAVGKVSQITVISKLVQIIISVLLLVFGTGLIGICCAYLIYGLLFRILAKNSFFNYQGIGQNLKQVNTSVTKEESKELFLTVWHNAWREGIISLSNYLCNQSSSLICGYFLSLAETGVYSLGVQLVTVIANVASGLYTAYQPALQSTFATGDIHKRKNIMSMIVMSYFYLYIIGIFMLIVIGLPLLELIKPEASVSIPVILAIGLYQFIIMFRNMYSSYFSCSNRLIYVPAFLISAVIGIGFSFVGMGWLGYGLKGLLGAQIISQLAFNFWYWYRKSMKEMNIKLFDMVVLFNNEVLKLLKNFVGRYKV